ncbi:MAG: hypothetical protein QOH39_3668 [Verrucomicrobiota bacterium]
MPVPGQPDHLAGMHGNGEFGMSDRVNTPNAFQDHEFPGCSFEETRPSADRRRDGSCRNSHFRAFWGHLNKNCAAGEVQVTRPSLETKHGIGSEPGNGQIGKGEFRARIRAGAHSCALFHLIIHHGGARCRLVGQQFYIFDDLRDSRIS